MGRKTDHTPTSEVLLAFIEKLIRNIFKESKMKKCKLISVLFITVFLFSFLSIAFATENETVWIFDKEDSKALFSSYRGITVNGIKDGALDTTLTGRGTTNDDPAFFSKTVDFDTAKYNQIVVKAKINIETISQNNSTTIYFKTDKAPAYSQSKTIGAKIETKNADYVDYVFDMGTHAEWSGICTGFFYSFHNNSMGSVQIKSITFRYSDSAKASAGAVNDSTAGITTGSTPLAKDVPTVKNQMIRQIL